MFDDVTICLSVQSSYPPGQIAVYICAVLASGRASAPAPNGSASTRLFPLFPHSGESTMRKTVHFWLRRGLSNGLLHALIAWLNCICVWAISWPKLQKRLPALRPRGFVFSQWPCFDLSPPLFPARTPESPHGIRPVRLLGIRQGGCNSDASHCLSEPQMRQAPKPHTNLGVRKQQVPHPTPASQRAPLAKSTCMPHRRQRPSQGAVLWAKFPDTG